MPGSPNNSIYAIDFGTSNSLMSCVQPPEEKISSTQMSSVQKSPHQDILPLRSIMYFDKAKNIYFGETAIQQYIQDSAEGRLIRSIKRFLPMPNFTSTRIGNTAYRLEELIARFLRELKSRMDRQIQADVTSLVLGRPAKFSTDPQRDSLAQNRLEKAAQLAGFENIYFLPEPIAAAYSFRKQVEKEKIILISDLGGGTSDFTIFRLDPSHSLECDVLALHGIPIAGDAMDARIMDQKISHFFASNVEYRLPMSNNVLKMPSLLRQKLSTPAEITLMSNSDIMGFLQDVRRNTFRPEDQEKFENLFCLISENLGFALFDKIESLKKNLGRAEKEKFEFKKYEIDIEKEFLKTEIFQSLESPVSQIIETLQETLNMAQLKPSDIDYICCTGGTSYLQSIQEALKNLFGLEKIQNFDNFQSVINGLTMHAERISQDS